MKDKISDRTHQNLIALFTCLTTRGFHLEVVNNLSTDGFILVLCQFCVHRGYLHMFHSVNDSNFVGAEWELKDSLKKLDTNKIEIELNEN